MSLEIVPKPYYPSVHAHTSRAFSAPSAPGVHDTLRTAYTNTAPTAYNLPTTSFAPSTISSSSTEDAASNSSTHPLEARLRNWSATQYALKQSLLRRQFGIYAPLMRDMELCTVAAGERYRPVGVLGRGANVHMDILRGTDWEVDGWEDVFSDGDVWGVAGGENTLGVAGEMERAGGVWGW